MNRPTIDALINQYEPGRVLHVYKGMRKTLPRDAFPSLEIEPSSGSTQWITTETQGAQYSVTFTLTVLCSRDDMSVEYMAMIARLLTELFNNPANMALPIPYERGYNVEKQMYTQQIIQFSMVNNITYNQTKDGTFRVAQWDWTGNVREAFPRDFYERDTLASLDLEPHDLPPVPNWDESL